MLFCVSVGITHFWLVAAMRCLIKALPQKKNRLITGEIIKGSEWLCGVTLKMGEEKQIKTEKGRMQSTHCAEVCQHSGRTMDSKWQLCM